MGDDLKFAKLLWQHMAIKVIPGSYMAVLKSNINPAAGYVRIAMVHRLEVIEEAMQRLQVFIEDIWQDNKTNE